MIKQRRGLSHDIDKEEERVKLWEGRGLSYDTGSINYHKKEERVKLCYR